MRRMLSATVLVAMLAIGLGPTVAFAATNDSFDSAEVIASFPFSAAPDLTGATTEVDEPQACYGSPNTVWYTFAAPGVGTVMVHGRYDANLVMFSASGPGFAGLYPMQCAYAGRDLQVPVQPGVTYYVQYGSYFGGGGPADVTFTFVPPPANDDFASATTIASLPFTDSTGMFGATLQPGEPIPTCWFGPRYGSVWYRFTPSMTASVTASVSALYFSDVSIYTGSSFDTLTTVACQANTPTATIKAVAGVTYYIEVSAIGGLGESTFSLVLAGPPLAAFSTTSGDPSTFDLVGFVDQSSDPGNVGIASEAWAFGDGSSATGPYAQHRYSTDGDYTAKLTVTTTDGRVGSLARTISVRTHDIAITKLTVPTAASSGQTRSITVGVSNRRYPETVIVTLTRTTPFGTVPVGTLQQTVPVRAANRTTDFTFSYTFTSEDAAIGKVSFQATASLLTARDALPGDNLAQSLPTKVSR